MFGLIRKAMDSVKRPNLNFGLDAQPIKPIKCISQKYEYEMPKYTVKLSQNLNDNGTDFDYYCQIWAKSDESLIGDGCSFSFHQGGSSAEIAYEKAMKKARRHIKAMQCL